MENIEIKSTETVINKIGEFEFLECTYLEVTKRLIAYKKGDGIVKLFIYQNFFDWILTPKNKNCKSWSLDELDYKDEANLSIYVKRILFIKSEYDTIKVFFNRKISDLEKKMKSEGGLKRWIESYDDTRMTFIDNQSAIITSKVKMEKVICTLENEEIISKIERV